MDNTSNDQPTEQRILEAAHEIFVQKGLDGAKMQEIADRAGINKALLHYYYRSKERLFETVTKGVLRAALPVFRNIIEEDIPLKEKLEQLIENYVEIVGRNPFVPMFILTEVNKNPDRFLEQMFPLGGLPQPQFFIRQVEEAVASGTIRPIDGRHLIVNVLSLCVFPILARPLLSLILGMDEKTRKDFYKERASQIKEFVFRSIYF